MIRILFFLLLVFSFPNPIQARDRFIDLTHPFNKQTIYWPTAKPFELEIVHKGKTAKGFWYEANNLCAAEHGGTHLDSPVHFAKGKWTVDQIPLDKLIGSAVIIDVSKKTKKNADYLISPEDIISWEAQRGKIASDVMVFVYTGWSKRWPNKKKYLGTDKKGDVENLHFPGFSPDAAKLLVTRKISAVGLDTPSIDYGQSKDFPSHVIFGSANVLGFENLNNLNRLPPTGTRIVALPMKIEGGSGAPLRIVAEIQ